MASTILIDRFGNPKLVNMHDPVWDSLDNRRVRFAGIEFDGMVNVEEDDGRVLPDLRHPSQVTAY